MKSLSTVLLAAGLCFLATEIVRGENLAGGVRGGARPFISGAKSGVAAGRVGAGRPFVAGSRLNGFGGYGAVGVGGYGFGVGYGGFGYGGGYGYGFSETTLLYRLGYIPVPPYYALHPPVYYGQRVFRTYGESPFADFPSSRSARQPASSQLIINTTVPSSALGERASTTGDRTVGNPALGGSSVATSSAPMIFNPFYDGPPAETEQLARVASE